MRPSNLDYESIVMPAIADVVFTIEVIVDRFTLVAHKSED
jgi:hypothetical protein